MGESKASSMGFPIKSLAVFLSLNIEKKRSLIKQELGTHITMLRLDKEEKTQRTS